VQDTHFTSDQVDIPLARQLQPVVGE
jgi:hypothetical protein